MKPTYTIDQVFHAVIVAGISLASSQATHGQTEEDTSLSTPHCQVELQAKKYGPQGKLESVKATCLDEASEEEILAAIERAREEACLTPFCGCWLG